VKKSTQCRFNGLDEPVTVRFNDIGAFDKEYEISCDQPYTQSIINWLAVNCEENFIVSQDTCTILAGGRYTNRNAFENGKFDIDYVLKNELHDKTFITYRIRITEADDVMFKLVWVK